MGNKQNLLVAVLAMVCVMGVAAQDWPGADSSNSGWPGTEKKADKPAPAPAPAAESAPAPAPAQSAASDSGSSDSAPAQSSGGGSAPRKSSGGGGGGVLAIIVGYLAKIGGMFGPLAGLRIGGTTGTGILALVIAHALKDKAPDWVRYVLMAGGGTMFTGSGANIVDQILRAM